VSGLVEAARFATPVQAHLVRAYLESFGLQPVLFDAQSFAIVEGFPYPVRLMVIEDELDEARRLLADYKP
jgi:hypothetical protein